MCRKFYFVNAWVRPEQNLVNNKKSIEMLNELEKVLIG